MSRARVPAGLLDFVPSEIAVAMASAAFRDPFFDLSLGKRGAWREREPSDQARFGDEPLPPHEPWINVELARQARANIPPTPRDADQAALSAWRDVEAARRLVADRAELGAVGEQARPDARTLAILGRAMAALDAALAEVET